MVSPSGLTDIAAYADYIGVESLLIEPRDEAGAAQPPTLLIPDAHAAGLKVAAWTFRAENLFLPLGDRRLTDPQGHGDLEAQIRRFAGYGLDAVFCDFPAIATAVRA
jgi:glycerophosphoryl diester phosphodiesterase